MLCAVENSKDEYSRTSGGGEEGRGEIPKSAIMSRPWMIKADVGICQKGRQTDRQSS